MGLSADDLTALWLTIKLAAVVTLLLILISTPIAWWLANTRSRLQPLVSAVVALPLVLPPTVLGFYLLMAMGPQGPVGKLTESLGLGLLPFTFNGLVVGSLIYSLPFVVQPLQNAMRAVGRESLDAAATLGASPLDRFFSIVIPQSRQGFLTAAVLGFAHTLGEFGVVLMIGGNIAGETRVASVQIYDHVEALDFARAQGLSLTMVAIAFTTLLLLYLMNGRAAWLAEGETPGHQRRSQP